MAPPLEKLSDNFADYELRISCRKCGHVRVTEPHALARIVGWETPVAKVVLKLRCSKCNAQGESELTALKRSKPRKYRSH
jgi:ribosomal protein L44E